jgi:hypothetical protein
MAGEDVHATLSTLATQLSYVQHNQEVQAKALVKISDSLQHMPVVQMQLGQVLEAMADGRNRMDELDRRLQHVERVMPGLVEVRKWIITGLLAGVALMCTAMLQAVVWGPAQQQELVKQVLQAQQPKP